MTTETRRSRTTVVLGIALIAAALYPVIERAASRLVSPASQIEADRLTCEAMDPAVQLRVERLGPLLASWETVGGCGAGASTGTGGGVKWIGRNVSGGLFHLECQGNYVRMPYGNNLIVSTLISRDLTEKWNLGVSGSFLSKYVRDPYGIGIDVTNRGPGDTNVLLTRRLGPINATSATLSVGIPTGVHDAEFRTQVLRQDQQLGFGRVTGTLIVDHTLDHLWGLSLIGATAGYRGGTNSLESYRGPSASGYAYTSYLLGPLAPAIGFTVTGVYGDDKDRNAVQPTPRVSLAANASIEWATDYFALLLGASLPYEYDGVTKDVLGNAVSPWGLGPWVVALGFAVSPF